MWTFSAIKPRVLILLIDWANGTNFNLWAYFFNFLHGHIIIVHCDCVLVSAFHNVIVFLFFIFFAFHTDWKAALFFIFCGVVLWTVLFMYLVTSPKCLALLQGRFCNFACFNVLWPSLLVLLLPYAVLGKEKRLTIQVLWIFPHSLILLPILIAGGQEVSARKYSVVCEFCFVLF